MEYKSHDEFVRERINFWHVQHIKWRPRGPREAASVLMRERERERERDRYIKRERKRKRER